MKKIILHIFLLLNGFMVAQTTNPDLLVTIQKASQTEIDAYNTANLELGMLVYNTDENRIYEYTNQGWLELLTASNVYVGAFEISNAGLVTVSNIPFRDHPKLFLKQILILKVAILTLITELEIMIEGLTTLLEQ